MKRTRASERSSRPLERLSHSRPLFFSPSLSLSLSQAVPEGMVAAARAGGVTEAVGVGALKKRCESHESKRLLKDSHDVFLADDRILPLLPRILGSKFFSSKKQPIPVCLSRGDGSSVRERVRKALSGTVFLATKGTSVTVKIGRGSMTAGQLADNATAAFAGAVALLPGGSRSVASAHLKTAESLALPVLQRLPEKCRI